MFLKLTTSSKEPYLNFGKNDKIAAEPKIVPFISPHGAKKNVGAVSTMNRAILVGFSGI